MPIDLKDKAGMPRFAVDSFVVGRSDGPDADSLDRYGYTVVYHAGSRTSLIGRRCTGRAA